LWSCFGAPGAAWLVAEGLYRTFGITRGTLALATLPVVGVISWLVFRSCRFGPVRALLYTLVSLAMVGGLFVLLAYWIGPNL
jgi:hypothetical protein